MKFVCMNQHESNVETLTPDFKGAKKYENVLLGEKYLFFKKNFFTYYYIDYSTIKFAFRRVMVVPLRKKEIQVDYLVIAEKRKELAQAQLAGHNIAAEILDALKEKAPDATFKCPERIKK